MNHQTLLEALRISLERFSKTHLIEKKRKLLLLFTFCLFVLSNPSLEAQVVVNEITDDGTVELKNLGNTAVNTSTFWLCNFPAYVQIQNTTLVCGNMMLGAGEIMAVSASLNFDGTDGEMGLYTSNSFASASAIIDYVEWGSGGHQRSGVAAAAGIWTSGDFAPTFSGQALAYSGMGDSSADWLVAAPTTCDENAACDVTTGDISLDDGSTETSICVDGNPDPLNIVTTGGTGTSTGWIITDDANNILAIPPAPPFDLDGAGPGTCLIWYVTYDDIAGNMVGNTLSDITGCFDISNPVTVIREEPDGGMVSLIDGSTTYTGTAGNIVIEVQHTTTASNLSYWYIITDDNDNILAFANSADGNTLDLSGAPPGECHVWGWSYRGLDDPIPGENISTLTDDDCEAISDNFITVIREAPVCEVTTGDISLDDGSTSTSICVDGNPDPLNIVTTGGTGTSTGWIITDDANNILALPPAPPFDLDGAGPGTCLIWYVTYDDIAGNMVGNTLSDITGCFDISNPVTVIREEPDGGMVSLIDGSTTYTGTAGNIVIEVQHTTTASNLSYWYIITDDNDNILAFANSADGNTLDLSGAPPGECHVWGWSYRGLDDPIMGENISTLTDDDCEAISDNFITVIREASVCEVTTGDISLDDGSTETSICVDGNPDPLNIVTTGGTGTSTGWIITDDANNILALPPAPPFDLDGAGPGTCLIWYVTYDDIAGNMVGNTLSDITGCFALSNPVTVIREEPDGGMVSLIDGSTTYTGTAGNIVIEVQHTTTASNLSYWYIITDDNDNILAFANSADGNTLDLSGAPPGECHVWGWSYRGLDDPIPGENISTLTDDDCEAISDNFITVIRSDIPCGDGVGVPVVNYVSEAQDMDMFVDGVGFDNNPSITFTDPGTPADAVLSNISLELFFRLNGNSCEHDISLQLTDPAGNTQIFTPFATCDGGSGLFYVDLDIPAGMTTGNVGDWVLQFDDTNDQNPDYEYSPRFARLSYSTTYTEIGEGELETINETISDIADQDLFIDGVGFFFNDSYTFSDPGTPANAVLSNISLELFFRLNGSSCENEIAMRLTDPANNTQFLTAYTTCNGGSDLFSVTLDIPSGNTIGVPKDWVLRFDDTNDQNPDYEYSPRFARLTYDVEYTTCMPITPATNEHVDLSKEDTDVSTHNEMKVFPVPASQYLNIEYFSEDTGQMSMQILSSEGKLMMSQEGLIQEGFNTLQLNIADLPAGHYYIRAFDRYYAQTKPFVKL